MSIKLVVDNSKDVHKKPHDPWYGTDVTAEAYAELHWATAHRSKEMVKAAEENPDVPLFQLWSELEVEDIKDDQSGV